MQSFPTRWEMSIDFWRVKKKRPVWQRCKGSFKVLMSLPHPSFYTMWKWRAQWIQLHLCANVQLVDPTLSQDENQFADLFVILHTHESNFYPIRLQNNHIHYLFEDQYRQQRGTKWQGFKQLDLFSTHYVVATCMPLLKQTGPFISVKCFKCSDFWTNNIMNATQTLLPIPYFITSTLHKYPLCTTSMKTKSVGVR